MRIDSKIKEISDKIYAKLPEHIRGILEKGMEKGRIIRASTMAAMGISWPNEYIPPNRAVIVLASYFNQEHGGEVLDGYTAKIFTEEKESYTSLKTDLEKALSIYHFALTGIKESHLEELTEDYILTGKLNIFNQVLTTSQLENERLWRRFNLETMESCDNPDETIVYYGGLQIGTLKESGDVKKEYHIKLDENCEKSFDTEEMSIYAVFCFTLLNEQLSLDYLGESHPWSYNPVNEG